MRIDVRGDNIILPQHTRQLIDRSTRVSLGRFATAIRDVRIVLSHLSSPTSGVAQSCTVQVQLAGDGEVHVTADDAVLLDAVARALDRAARSTFRLIARRHGFRHGVRRFTADQPRY